jgi:hypothetical protein
MVGLSVEEMREFLLGISVPVTLVVATRIDRNAVTREDLIHLVGEAAWLARDRRQASPVDRR